MTPTFLIFALGFANWAMLSWLAVAAAPIAIYLWMRQRHREMPWAAMEYLLAAIQQTSRRLRVEHWLLLLVRTAIIVLVVLAVAEPFVQRSGMAFPSAQPVHRILVIDASYSMDYKPNDGTRFEQAKQLAAEIAQESQPGDGLSLMVAAAPPRVVVGAPVLNFRTILPDIANLTPCPTAADWPATLTKIEAVLQDARRTHPGLARNQVIFLTDLGRVGWAIDPVDRTAVDAFRDRARQLARSAELVVIDLGQADAENLAVVQLRTDNRYVTPGRPVPVEARIRSFGRKPHPGQSVDLFVDGRQADSRKVDVPADGSVSVRFTHTFDAPGQHILEVRARGDRLAIDNRRWLVLPVKPHLRVLCIDGRPSGQPFGGTASYLRIALAPEAAPSATGPVQVEVAPENAILHRDLSPFDCIFLADVAQFTANEARVLNNYAEQGGGLVFFMGERAMTDRYNHELADEGHNAVELLPARLGPIVETSPEDRRLLDPLDYRHPIVRPFRGQEKAGLLTTPISKYVKLDLAGHTAARVALRTDNGDPLIVDQPVGRGRVILVATSADTAWTSMPLWPSYVPIVQELLAYAVAGQIEEHNVLVGQPLEGSVAASPGNDRFALRAPDGASDQLRLQSQNDLVTWTFAPTTQIGVYTAASGPSSQVTPFAVNLDTTESDLAKLTPSQMRDEIWPGVPFTYQTSSQQPDQQILTHSRQRGTLSSSLLAIALGLLLLETVLAWRFGHQTQ